VRECFNILSGIYSWKRIKEKFSLIVYVSGISGSFVRWARKGAEERNEDGD